MKPILGSIVALVTPMNEDGSIDYPGPAPPDRLAYRGRHRLHRRRRHHGRVAHGQHGREPRNHSRGGRAHAKGRVPVLAGTGANSTAEAIELSRYAKEVGADCTLSVVPYYNKPSQEGIYQHFKAIAEAVDIPMMLYNVPGRTVADLLPETTLRCATLPGVFGIKEATGNIERAAFLIKHAPEGFHVYSGDDGTAVALMLLGGHGNVSVTANVAPRQMAELCRLAMAGNAVEARKIHLKLLGLHKQLFCEPSPGPAKWALSRLGRCGASLRLPITPLTAGRPGHGRPGDGRSRIALSPLV